MRADRGGTEQLPRRAFEFATAKEGLEQLHTRAILTRQKLRPMSTRHTVDTIQFETGRNTLVGFQKEGTQGFQNLSPPDLSTRLSARVRRQSALLTHNLSTLSPSWTGHRRALQALGGRETSTVMASGCRRAPPRARWPDVDVIASAPSPPW
jgi:hypothetical protein